jgi:hypothetical protein
MSYCKMLHVLVTCLHLQTRRNHSNALPATPAAAAAMAIGPQSSLAMPLVVSLIFCLVVTHLCLNDRNNSLQVIDTSPGRTGLADQCASAMAGRT